MRCGLLKAQRWDVESGVLRIKCVMKGVRPKPSGARPNEEIDADFRKAVFERNGRRGPNLKRLAKGNKV